MRTCSSTEKRPATGRAKRDSSEKACASSGTVKWNLVLAEQRTCGDGLVENDNVEESQRIHVRDLREVVEAQSFRLLVKRGRGHARALELSDTNLIEQSGGKIGSHDGPLVSAEGSRECGVVVALLAQVGGNAVGGLDELRLGKFGRLRGLCGRHAALQAGIVFVQSAGGFDRFTQEFGLAEAG